LEFYREDEIVSAKQLLVQATERVENLNFQSFMKKRNGVNKCKSSVDDIMNIVKQVDENSCYDKLPTYCAVKRSRVPIIAQELSDMAAIGLELNQLCQHVEVLSNQLSSISHCTMMLPAEKSLRRAGDSQQHFSSICSEFGGRQQKLCRHC